MPCPCTMEEEGVKVGGVTQTVVTPTEVDGHLATSKETGTWSCLERRNHSALKYTISQYFASISDSIRKLPLRMQSDLKFKMHALVHDAGADFFLELVG